MNNCEICGKSCGEYTLCPDCFKLMQEGKVLKCKNCGHWYKDGEMCKCILAPGATPPPVSSTSAPAPAPTTENAETEKKQLGCFPTLIIAFLIIGVLIAISLAIMNASEENQKPSKINVGGGISTVTKTAPTLSYNDSNGLTGYTTVSILVKANDNYDEVTVELHICAADGTIIKKTHLTETDLVKGQTYTLTYNLSAYELENGAYSEASIYKYK